MDIETILYAVLIGGASTWVFSTLLGRLHNHAISKLPHSNKEDANEVEQRRTIDYEATYDDIFLRSTEALKEISRLKIKSLDKVSMQILATTPVNWKTLGDRIRVAFEIKGSNAISVSIFSAPRLSTTSVDYGKNFDNVEIFLASLDANFKRI